MLQIRNVVATRMPRLTGHSLLAFASTIILLALLVAPSVYLGITGNFNSPSDRLLMLSGSVFGCLLVIACMATAWRAGWLLLFILAFIALFQIGFIYLFGWSLDANAIALIGESSISDAWEMAGAVPAGTYFIAGLFLGLAALAWSRPAQLVRLGRPAKMRLWALAVIPIACCYATVVIANIPIRIGEKSNFPRPISQNERAWRASYPTGLPWVIFDFLREQDALKHGASRLVDYRFGIDPLPPQEQRRIYVLVIGEASRADRWSLNGYHRNTTPMLARRPELISFSRLYSPWAFSRLAVPLLITRKPEHSTAPVHNEASIVTAFKEAGFRTAWLSMKPAVGFNASPVSIHAAEADEVTYLNFVDKGPKVKHDRSALPSIVAALDSTDQDLFLVVHTIGSHFDYADRYGPESRIFRPDRPPSGGGATLYSEADRLFLSNAYDNSIVETDRFLDTLISELDRREDTESWLYYSSDHGEALFDDCRNLSGHGQVVFHTQSVAAVFWASPAYSKKRPGIMGAMRDNADVPLSIASTFATLSDLGGIRVPGGNRAGSFAQPAPEVSQTALAAERDRALACTTDQPLTVMR